jgi:hypothetical protein
VLGSELPNAALLLEVEVSIVYAPVFPSSMMDFETAGEVVAKEPEVYLLTIGWKPDF